MKCPNCGTENHDDARFCKSCAAPQTPPPPASPQAVPPPTPTPVAVWPPPPPPPVPRRPRLPHEDLLGLLGFAFFLTAIAVVFGQNPNLIPGLGRWFDLISASRTVFVRPPDAVITSAGWFFAVVGGFEFVSAFLRWTVRWPPLRVAGRVLTGTGDLAFSFLLFRYADRAISGGILITVLVGVFAALLMVYVTLGAYWSTSRYRSWPSSHEPSARH